MRLHLSSRSAMRSSWYWTIISLVRWFHLHSYRKSTSWYLRLM